MLRELFAPRAVSLSLSGRNRTEVLGELVSLLGLAERDSTAVQKLLVRREALGTTSVGRGVAIPHCRTLVADRVRLAYGFHAEGVEFGAVDGRLVHHFFLIVAPPMEVSQQYLPVLAKVAQFVKHPNVPAKLATLASEAEFHALLDSTGL